MKKVLVILSLLITGFVQAQHDEVLRGNIFDPERHPVATASGAAEAFPAFGEQPEQENMYFSLLLSRSAEDAGLQVNAISNRRSLKTDDVNWSRVYLGYDGDLAQLMRFFALVDDRVDGIQLEGMTISARRKPKRARMQEKRSPLNGNIIFRFANGEQAAEASGERHVATRLLLGLTQILPKDGHLLSLVIKAQDTVVIMGEAADKDRVFSEMKKASFLKDLKTTDAFSDPEKKGHYLFKADFHRAGLPIWEN